MPVTPGAAKLWFSDQEDEQAYDDKMVANIELKSLDFDDENFSPVFNRATKEVFLQASKKFLFDLKSKRGESSFTFADKIDAKIQPCNLSYNRNWTFTKFLAGFGVGYLVLRELPLRNFYARVLVMSLWFGKLSDHVVSYWPFTVQLGAANDHFHHRDLRCYNVANKVTNLKNNPTTMNQLQESYKWRNVQPGHVHFQDVSDFVGNITRWFKDSKPVVWDGTFNMPIYRLTDKKSKDSHMMVGY